MAKRVAAKASAAEQMARACERAKASGLQIVGRGWRVADGALAWAVPSQRDASKRYIVVLCHDRLSCECEGHRVYALTCIHMGVVLNMLAAEARIFADAQRQQVASASTAHPSHPGDTAILHRDNAPISIWRA